MKCIFDYFTDTVEYPQDIADNILPWGVCWGYVSSTFLNGFINYVEPISVFVLDRYNKQDDDISGRQMSYKFKGESEWRTFIGTKSDAIKCLNDGTIEQYHTRISCLGDDVLILARIKREEGNTPAYMFFWFDMDVSDCFIGRFESTDPVEVISASIPLHVEKNKDYFTSYGHGGGIHELNVKFLKGWVSF